MYVDPDGNDVVYFDKSGKEIGRIKSKIRFETYVKIEDKLKDAAAPEISPLAGGFIQAPMPNRIESQPSSDKNDYNKNDPIENAVWKKRISSV